MAFGAGRTGISKIYIHCVHESALCIALRAGGVETNFRLSLPTETPQENATHWGHTPLTPKSVTLSAILPKISHISYSTTPTVVTVSLAVLRTQRLRVVLAELVGDRAL